jgi:hypothetical protein
MKCLYIGDFKKSYSTELYVTYALEQNGVDVYKLDDSHVSSASIVRNVVFSFKPDFVLFCKNHVAMNSYALIKALREMGVPTVTWVFDLYFDLPVDRRNRTVLESNFETDIVFSTDGGHDKEFLEYNINHRVLRQGIHLPEAKYGKRSAAPEVAFIGSVVYADRLRLIKFLEQTYGDKFKHYGIGSHGSKGEVRGMDLNNLLASTKIVVGDSQPSPGYWSNRLYEITGRGGFLIHPRVEGLEKEFEYGKEIGVYDWGNLDQLKTVVDYYLAHDDEREAIRKAGHERTKSQYTYTIRAAELIKIVKECLP